MKAARDSYCFITLPFRQCVNYLKNNPAYYAAEPHHLNYLAPIKKKHYNTGTYQTIPSTPSQEIGPPWYCAIRKAGILECEITSWVSLKDAETKAAKIADLLNNNES
jgi:hypothetical protein